MTTTNESDSPAPSTPAPKSRSFRRRVLSRISIQSKLLAMLLVTSVLSAAVVGAIGYQSGRSSLRASVFDRLTEIRASQTRQLESQFSDLKNSLVIYTRGATTTEAVKAFTPASTSSTIRRSTPAQWQSIVDYYNGAVPEGRGRPDRQPVRGRRASADDESAEVSAGVLHRALQRLGQGHSRSTMRRDGSPWSAANAQIQRFLP